MGFYVSLGECTGYRFESFAGCGVQEKSYATRQLAVGSPSKLTWSPIWEFPKLRGTILGVPIIRTIVFWGLYWGPPIWVCALKGVPFRGCLDWGMLREYVSGYVSGFDSGYASRYASESFIRPEYKRLNSNYREERREGRGAGV